MSVIGSEKQRRILFVEDEDFTRTAVTSSLSASGFQVHAFATVAEALDALEECDPHALVTDLDLGSGPSGIGFNSNESLQNRPWVGW